MANVDETLLGVRIGKNSITWGDLIEDNYDGEACLPISKYGFYKRQNEPFVLPYAVGCQPPTFNHKYSSLLTG